MSALLYFLTLLVGAVMIGVLGYVGRGLWQLWQSRPSMPAPWRPFPTEGDYLLTLPDQAVIKARALQEAERDLAGELARLPLEHREPALRIARRAVRSALEQAEGLYQARRFQTWRDRGLV